MTIEITREAFILGAKWAVGLIILAALLRAVHDSVRAWSHRRWVDEQRRLDRQQDHDREVFDADRDRATRDREPLPGPRLIAEAVRRMIYAEALERTKRPAAAAAQRRHAEMLGALSHMAMMAGGEPDRADWSAAFAAAEQLIGAPLLNVEGFTDVPPALAPATRPPYAELGTPEWADAVRALAAAIRDKATDIDLGPGMEGDGILTASGRYGYAAAPELDRDTVHHFVRDWQHALFGDEREHVWPADIEWPRMRTRWMRDGLTPADGMAYTAAIAALRQHADQVVQVEDFRGLMGRGKSQIVEEIIERYGRQGLSYDTIDRFMSDYSVAITCQPEQVAGDWPAGALPAGDPSRNLSGHPVAGAAGGS